MSDNEIHIFTMIDINTDGDYQYRIYQNLETKKFHIYYAIWDKITDTANLLAVYDTIQEVEDYCWMRNLHVTL